MKVNLKEVRKVSAATFSNHEIEAIERLLKDGERFGYGNLMSWLATAWVKKIPHKRGAPFSVTAYPVKWLKHDN